MNTIKTKFLPTIIDGTISDLQGTLPACEGEMGVHNPVESAEIAYAVSKEATTKIVCAIKGDNEFSLQEHMERIAETHSKLCNEGMEQDQRKLDTCSVGVNGSHEEVCSHESS